MATPVAGPHMMSLCGVNGCHTSMYGNPDPEPHMCVTVRRRKLCVCVVCVFTPLGEQREPSSTQHYTPMSVREWRAWSSAESVLVSTSDGFSADAM